MKERFSKAYRHPTLDKKLTQRRLFQEARSLNRCKKIGVAAPTLYFVDTVNNRIFMEFIQGTTLRRIIDTNTGQGIPPHPAARARVNALILKTRKENVQLAREIGRVIAKLHENDIVHGDLTTSNMILSKETLVCEKLWPCSFFSNFKFLIFSIFNFQFPFAEKPSSLLISVSAISRAWSRTKQLTSTCLSARS